MPPATEPAPAGEAVRLVALSRAFGSGKLRVAALDAVSAVAASGAVTGLIGPDGAGKTTLMRLICGLLRPDHGRIEVFGADIAGPRATAAMQARLGYMPQRFGLYEDLTVQENLDLYADLRGLPPDERPGRYGELLHMTGLAGFTARMAGRLSGGMKQKLGLACTLVRAPDLLLLDEPTVGVDPVSRRELWEIIDHLTGTAGMSVLFSTAYLDEAARCDAVLLLHQGRLLGAGPPEEMTAPLAGRVFATPVPAPARRHAQARLAAMDGVIDAVIQGDGVRLVLARPPTAPSLDGHALTAVAPRFEDGFVARLRGDDPPPARHLPADPPAPREDGAPVIVVEHLTRRFGSFVAVRDVGFSVRRGEIFGLLGANGAGKSTCFRMLCGLLPASEGRLEVAGFDLRRAAAPARGQIGYMAQKFSLYGDLSVRQNLRFFAAAYGLRGASLRDRIDWAVGEFDLAPMLGGNARDLPLGFKQRLALACALMHQPRILFLDEPTSGVDPLARREFWRRISLLAESGVTVLVTTHFMEEAEYCDRLVIMAQGAVLAAGSPDAIKKNAGGGDGATMEDAFIAVIEAAATARAA